MAQRGRDSRDGRSPPQRDRPWTRASDLLAAWHPIPTSAVVATRSDELRSNWSDASSLPAPPSLDSSQGTYASPMRTSSGNEAGAAAKRVDVVVAPGAERTGKAVACERDLHEAERNQPNRHPSPIPPNTSTPPLGSRRATRAQIHRPDNVTGVRASSADSTGSGRNNSVTQTDRAEQEAAVLNSRSARR